MVEKTDEKNAIDSKTMLEGIKKNCKDSAAYEKNSMDSKGYEMKGQDVCDYEKNVIDGRCKERHRWFENEIKGV